MKKRAVSIEANVNKTVKQTAIAVDQTVVLATPVDTGRARANWQASIGAPETDKLDIEDPSGQETIDKNNDVINSRERGQDIYLSNNLDYIGPLNEGHSAQAPAGFVEEAIQVGVAAVRKARVL